MKEYFVDEIKNKKVYDNFIQYMLEHSDFFSVVYFRNRKDSPLNKYLKNYKKALRPYILHAENTRCLLYTSPSPRDRTRSRMPSSA